MDIKIYNKNFDLSPSFEEYLKEKLGALEKYKMDIMGFHVELTRDKHHHKGEVYNIEVHVSLPNKNSITMAETHDDPHAAVDLLQTRLARQLVKYKAKTQSKFRKQAKLIKKLKFWRRGKEY